MVQTSAVANQKAKNSHDWRSMILRRSDGENRVAERIDKVDVCPVFDEILDRADSPFGIGAEVNYKSTLITGVIDTAFGYVGV